MGLEISHWIPSSDIELEYLPIEELNNVSFVKKHEHLFKYIEIEGKRLQVLFVKEKGYQRKGMKKSFYNDFENNRLYFDLNSVIKASRYLEPSKVELQSKLQQRFKESFIDNFVGGKSIFSPNW